MTNDAMENMEKKFRKTQRNFGRKKVEIINKNLEKN